MWHLASLGRVLDECEFPGFSGTFKMLRLPVIRFASLRSRCSAIPRLQSARFVPLVATVCTATSLELVTRCLLPGSCRGNGRASQVPGEPQYSSAHVLRPRPDGDACPNRIARAAPAKKKTKAPTHIHFRGSIAWLLNSLSTLRSADYSGPTQDSLPTAGKALPGGFAPLGSYERFQIINA
jgi:hypothetical protein